MTKEITFKIIPSKGHTELRPENIDKDIRVEVFEGYKSLGKYTLSDIRIKFR